MGWPEISIEDFPPKRDDEPASLRQDIIDELTDHFACAFNRELLKNPDEQLARQRVIIEFGDPVKIARQLWLDAMKEKIMSQRIMTGISVAMAVCCMLVVGIAWVMMKESHVVNHQMLEQLAIIADRPQADSTVVKSLQRTNEAIVRELKILSESQRPSRQPEGMGSVFGAEMEGTDGLPGAGGEFGGFGSEPAEPSNINQQILNQLEQLNQNQNALAASSSNEMNPILFQLVEGNKEGKPAIGFKGNLTKYEGNNVIYKVDAVSDKNGLLDFGKLPWGNYKMRLSAPWNAELSTRKITTIPGRKYEETIFCPEGIPTQVPIEFQVDWQGKPVAEDMFLLCDFRSIYSTYGTKERRYNLSSSQIIRDDHWTYRHNLTLAAERGVYLIDVKNNRVIFCPLKDNGNFKNLEFENLVWKTTVEVLQGSYQLPTIYLIRKSELSKLSELNSINTLGLIFSTGKEMNLMRYANPGRGMFISPFGKFNVEPQLLEFLRRKNSQAASLLNAFQVRQPIVDYKAKNEKPNIWKIIVPELDPITLESGSLNSVP